MPVPAQERRRPRPRRVQSRGGHAQKMPGAKRAGKRARRAASITRRGGGGWASRVTSWIGRARGAGAVQSSCVRRAALGRSRAAVCGGQSRGDALTIVGVPRSDGTLPQHEEVCRRFSSATGTEQLRLWQRGAPCSRDHALGSVHRLSFLPSMPTNASHARFAAAGLSHAARPTIAHALPRGPAAACAAPGPRTHTHASAAGLRRTRVQPGA